MHRNFLLVIGVMFLLSFNDLFWVTPLGDPEGLMGLAATSHMDRVVNGLVAGISSAAALAVDTEVGFVGLVLSRNVSRRNYILDKALAIVAVAALATLIRYAWLMAIGAIVLPWDVPALGDCLLQITDPDGRMPCVLRTPNSLKDAPGPFPALFLTHPVVNDLILIVLTALGTGVLALLGLLVAACGGNVYLAIAVPTVFVFFIPRAIRDFSDWLEPTQQLLFRVGYFRMLPGEEYHLGIWFAYWVGLAVILIGLSIFIAEKRELAQKVHGT